MTIGYIYVLQNAAFGDYVVKVGLTTRGPNLRAREIYNGATGVPLPFDVANAFSVGNCKDAEKRIHTRLATYRLNRRREFFRVPPRVASVIAHEVCCQVNLELGLPPPESVELHKRGESCAGSSATTELNSSVVGAGKIITVQIGDLRESPVGTCFLSIEQQDRSRLLSMIFSEVYPRSGEQWNETFSRDADAERELKIWEHIAKAFMIIDQVDLVTDDMKSEAFALLLARSWSSTSDVLRDVQLRHFSRPTANRLLKHYELKPMPLMIRNSQRAS